MKKNFVLAFAGAALLLSSCLDQKETATTFKTDEALEAVNVKVKNVYSTEVDQLSEFTANVLPDVDNDIAPQQPTRIRKIFVEVGNHVQKGQVLVELDDNALMQAELALAQARVDFARTEELYKQGAVSQSNYENAKMAIDVKERQYQNLAENQKLLAPTDGVVTARNYDSGDLYNGATPILVVQRMTPVKILLDVNEMYFKDVKVGMPVNHIALDAYPGEEFEGKVSIIYPSLDASTRTFKIEVRIANAKQRVRPGMFARVSLNFGAKNRVLVPDQAVVKQTGSGERFVYVVRDGKAYHQTVELGRRIGAEYEVLSGVEQDATVVVFGQTLLSDGRAVNILD